MGELARGKVWKNGGKSGFGGESRGPRRGAPRPLEAEKLMRAAARVGVSKVLASVSRLATVLVGRAATLSASLSF